MGDDYLKTYKRLGILFFATIIGLWNGCTDLSYMMSSKSAQGKIVRYYEVQTKRGPSTTRKNVTFKFQDAEGKQLQGYDMVDIEWQPKSLDGTVDIVYIPGKMRPAGNNAVARLKESGSYGGLMFFFLAFGLFSFYLVLTYRQMQSAPGA